MPEVSVRWELDARGRVQKVGYRDFVEEQARTRGLVGTVRNDEGNGRLVHVVVQGPAKALAEFLTAIGGRHGFAEAEVRKVGEAAADPTLVDFVQERGPPEKETLERADQSVLLLQRMADTEEKTLGVSKETLGVSRETLAVSKETLTEVRGVGAEVRDGNRRLEKSLDRMHEDMSVRFDRVDRAYGSIGKTLLRIDKNLEKLSKALLLLAKETHRAAVSASRAPPSRVPGKKGRRA